jgi:hypothetical protein
MKSIMSVLVVTIMVFALVSSGEAGTWFSCCTDNPGAVSAAHNTAGNASAKDADPPGHFLPYACGVKSPAYVHYTDAIALPCTARDRDSSGLVPEPMGNTGY